MKFATLAALAASVVAELPETWYDKECTTEDDCLDPIEWICADNAIYNSADDDAAFGISGSTCIERSTCDAPENEGVNDDGTIWKYVCSDGATRLAAAASAAVLALYAM